MLYAEPILGNWAPMVRPTAGVVARRKVIAVREPQRGRPDDATDDRVERRRAQDQQ